MRVSQWLADECKGMMVKLFNRFRSLVLRVGVLLALVLTFVGTGWQSITAQEADGEPVALGVMVEVMEDRNRLDALIDQIGRPPSIVMWHAHWGNESGVLDLPLLEYVSAQGVTPLITWESWRPLYAAGVAVATQPDFSLQQILNGAWDDYIDTWAEGIAEFGEPVYLRWGHEMNGDWYPWGVGVNDNTGQDFIDAWRYLHDRFEDAGADNVRWVWSPNASDMMDIEPLYPGDDYVDFVGMSGFNWGTSPQPWGVAGWQTFTEVFGPTYERLTAITDKPIMLTEVASSEDGGDKAAWITRAFLTELPESFPTIDAIVWFNIVKETDWRIDSSPESLRAFIEVANDPSMQGALE
jgi:hypothetical protein